MRSTLPSLRDTDQEQLKQEIRSFWENRPCGSVHASAPESDPEYFAQVERKRYDLEPFIPRYADFEAARGKKVLEIGIGLGTDFVRFARAGADLTGIDLTQRSIDLVARRLEFEGLNARLVRGDAEQLPFAESEFDKVYSWGVLMVTPDTTRACREAVRVLRPGGELCVMLYSRHSWLAYGLWVRYGLLRGRPQRTLAEVVANHMESRGMKAYTHKEALELFPGVQDVQIEKVGTPYDRLVAGPLVPWTQRQLGWFTVLRARKPTVGHGRLESASLGPGRQV